jgi:hypothetical protein
LVRDDITNLVLLYRKLLSTQYDVIAINTAYDRKDQKFVLNETITKTFPKVAYLGPTPIYEDYVKIANFPHWVDLDDYQDNTINVDMMEHLKTRHLNEVFPKQKTRYAFRYMVNQSEFENVPNEIDNDAINLAINMFDPRYDPDCVLQYDLAFCVDKIRTKLDRKTTVYLVGLIHNSYVKKVEEAAKEAFSTVDVKLINFIGRSFSEQMSLLLKVDYLLTGPYSWGVIAYGGRIPAYVLYPYHLYDYKGRMIDPDSTGGRYIETTDEDAIIDIDTVIETIANYKDNVDGATQAFAFGDRRAQI